MEGLLRADLGMMAKWIRAFARNGGALVHVGRGGGGAAEKGKGGLGW